LQILLIMSTNIAFLHGNLGKDPKIKTVGDKKVASFSIATTRSYKDKDGNKITDWHNILVWEKLAEFAEKYLSKGSEVIVSGEIQYRNYENKEGQKIYITEIICSRFDFIGKKDETKSAKEATPNEDLPF